MADQNETHPEQINKVNSRKFSDMGALEKWKFVGKVALFLVTGGFMFPTIFSD